MKAYAMRKTEGLSNADTLLPPDSERYDFCHTQARYSFEVAQAGMCPAIVRSSARQIGVNLWAAMSSLRALNQLRALWSRCS
jgi:hypothetical protein